jgi:hypothetical protein
MPKGDKWSVRGIDPHLVRRLRVLAVLRGVPAGVLLTEALIPYLEREEEKASRESPRPPEPEQDTVTEGRGGPLP